MKMMMKMKLKMINRMKNGRTTEQNKPAIKQLNRNRALDQPKVEGAARLLM